MQTLTSWKAAAAVSASLRVSAHTEEASDLWVICRVMQGMMQAYFWSRQRSMLQESHLLPVLNGCSNAALWWLESMATNLVPCWTFAIYLSCFVAHRSAQKSHKEEPQDQEAAHLLCEPAAADVQRRCEGMLTLLQKGWAISVISFYPAAIPACIYVLQRATCMCVFINYCYLSCRWNVLVEVLVA